MLDKGNMLGLDEPSGEEEARAIPAFALAHQLFAERITAYAPQADLVE